jgi:hypothetical protein
MVSVSDRLYQRLEQDKEIGISLGVLPKGNYTFLFSIINPKKFDFEVQVYMPGISSQKKTVTGTERINRYSLVFSVDPAGSGKAESVLFLKSEKGEALFLKSSLSAQYQNNNGLSSTASGQVYDLANLSFVADKEVRQSLKEEIRPTNIYVKTFMEVQRQNELMKGRIGNSHEPIFFELINYHTAEKQLDYVMRKKLFAGSGGNILKRMLRPLFRFFIVTFYRILASNAKLKSYLVKFYRNYVNLNYISELKK